MSIIYCKHIGDLKQDEKFKDWWESEEAIQIPLFNQKLKVTFRDLLPEKDKSFVDEASNAFHNFLSKKEDDKLNFTEEVYQNFQEFIDDVGIEDLEEELQNMNSKEEIWNFVTPSDIYITRRSKRDFDIYLEVTCECGWEEEHGLVLVFRQGKSLTRVSDQDGHLTNADAYNIPDSEDRLLSLFTA